MTSVQVYNMDGNAVETLELNDAVFNREINEGLMHQAVVLYLASRRQGTQKAKTRSEVSGGGKKPWRQKGTGNARQGSIRAPQWKGGGVVFAPKPRSFRKKVNKLAKMNAFTSALSAKLADGNLVVLDKLEIEPKTKLMAGVLDALKLTSRVLLVLPEGSDNALRAAHNIPTVRTSACESVNVYDVVANSVILTTVDAIKAIEQKYTAKEVVAQ